MMVSNVKGRFAGLTGTIIEDNEDFSRSSVQAEIDVDTVDTRNEQRDGHLKSPDFLHLEQHPKIAFKSTGIQGSGEQFKVAGDLTISGTTRPVTLNVTRNGTSTNPWGQVVVGYSAETTISRKDWGLTYNQALETGGFMVGDNLKIQLEIEAAKQA
jgi:polyisoprenoid-binding protein YceI